MTTLERIIAVQYPDRRWYGFNISLGHAVAGNLDPATHGWVWTEAGWTSENVNAREAAS